MKLIIQFEIIIHRQLTNTPLNSHRKYRAECRIGKKREKKIYFKVEITVVRDVKPDWYVNAINSNNYMLLSWEIKKIIEVDDDRKAFEVLSGLDYF